VSDERVRAAAFLILQTSPGNHQAWMAVEGGDREFSRRLKISTQADLTASGSVRVAGTFNYKRKYAPNFPIAGEPYRSIAKRFAASPEAVFRHGKDHVPAAMVHAKAAVVEVQAGTLFERLRTLNRETQEILREARDTKKHVIALQAIGRAEKQLELEARLLGELDDSAKIAIGVQVAPTIPDVSHLTDKQLFAQQRVLREAREKLDAIEAGEFEPGSLLEAGAGTVEEIKG
jgi:hypothetical protein